MRSKFMKICTATFALGALLSPAFSATIKPGVYKLDWVVPEGRDSFDSVPWFAEENPASLYTIGFNKVDTLYSIPGHTQTLPKGIVSKDALFGNVERFWIILDESRGTGTGYDVAYFAVWDNYLVGKIDIKKANKVRIGIDPCDQRPYEEKKSDITMLDDPCDVLLDYPIGDEKAPVMMKLGLDRFNVQIVADDCLGHSDASGSVSFRGGRQGIIKTSAGNMTIHAMDANGNGRYDDVCRFEGKDPQPYQGDEVRIDGSKEQSSFGYLSCGRGVFFDGKLYSIKVSKLGDKVEIRPYTGPVSRLKIRLFDGSGKPANLDCYCHVEGRDGNYELDKARELSIPAGKYHIYGSIISQQKRENRLEIESNNTIMVPKGKTTVWNIGGPAKVEIAPGSKVVTAKQGEKKLVVFIITAGGGKFKISSDAGASVQIRNASGEVVCKTDCPLEHPFLELPPNLEPGKYTINVSFDLEPYQKPVSAEKQLIITK